MRRVLAAILGAFYAASGIFMLVDSPGWLSFMIGHAINGPLPGQHFIWDVGLAFIASGLDFLVFAARPKLWAAAAVASMFPLLHALMHAFEMAQGHAPRLVFDLVVIVAPAVLGVLVAAQWNVSETFRRSAP